MSFLLNAAFACSGRGGVATVNQFYKICWSLYSYSNLQSFVGPQSVCNRNFSGVYALHMVILNFYGIGTFLI